MKVEVELTTLHKYIECMFHVFENLYNLSLFYIIISFNDSGFMKIIFHE